MMILYGGITINRNENNNLIEAVLELEKVEKEVCDLSLIFSEIFKDEINANDERKMFSGVKRVTKKYAENSKATEAIDEFVRVITGGASLKELFQIAKEEAVNPTLATEISVGNNCRLDNESH
jgi:light-regulated signal transduction histidine kinase (bacteriophytochrome)